VAISVITLGELKRGIEIRPAGKIRKELERAFRFVMEDFSGAIWVFDEGAAIEWGRLMGEAQVHDHPLPFADSMIAAIARNMRAKVVSRDAKGFAGCKRIDPWTDVEYPAWEQSEET
jgi:predicted nucleic acid-binding protein